MCGVFSPGLRPGLVLWRRSRGSGQHADVWYCPPGGDYTCGMNDSLENLVRGALAEDIGEYDITTRATVPAGVRCEARLIAKQDGVLSGMEPFRLAFDVMGSQVDDWNACLDGEEVKAGDMLATFTGLTRQVLTAERTAMNFVQHLSGVATLTAKYVAQLEGLECRVCDTRKTTPLLRRLEKAAVTHGGGANHRYNLFTGILIKENHITAAGGIAQAVSKARKGSPHVLRVEVEVTTLDELEQALAAGADVIMLDNMDLETMRAAVKRCAESKVLLEASGNATLERVRAMGETGVHFVSVGALTHSAPALDLSLLIRSA
jgi:nicotinate-nucleotide pyrophosphorylase (carboxylating)